MADFPKLSIDLIDEGLEGYQHILAEDLKRKQLEIHLFDELGKTLRHQQYFTLDQLEEILYWRQPTRPGHFKQNDRERVKIISKEAMKQEDEEIRMHILTLVKGVAIPSASKILSVTYPKLYVTMNKVSWRVLRSWRYLDRNYLPTIGGWMSFLKSVQAIMRNYSISGRQLDQVIIASFVIHDLKLDLQNYIPLDDFF